MKRAIHLLLIDDNAIDVRIITKLLDQHYGEPYNLTTKKTLAKGRDFFKKAHIDLILLDLNLPDSDTEKTLNFIEENEERYPIVVFSSIKEKDLRIKAIKKGAQDFLVKNEFDGPLLTRVINYSLERHILHRQLHEYADELKDKEQKLTESQALAQIGNWEFNPHNKILFWSREALNILEISNGEDASTLETFVSLIHPDDQKLVRDIFEQAIQNNLDFNEDIRVQSAPDLTKYINLRVRSHQRVDDGKEVIGTVQDITPRKEIEAKMRASEEKYHRLFEDSRDAIYITTKEGKFIDFNKATVELFGFTEEEMKKIEVSKLYYNPFEREKAKKVIEKKGYVRDFELMLKKKDGTKIDCMITSTVWRSNDGKQVGYQGIIRDITHLKRTQELIRNKEIAERSARLKEKFLANVSHEIRTPINAISGLTHLLLKTELSEKQNEYTTGIKTSSEHLLALVNDILDISKIEAGEIKFEKIQFNLKDHLQQLLNTLQHSAEEKNIDLTLDFDDQIPETVNGDPIKLNQIMINLLSNALKFTDTGFVKMKVKLLEDHEEDVVISLAVQDTGIGIPEKKYKTIFRSFSQLGKNVTKVAEGTGLGLAIVKQLVELQGGNISVKSKENEGSTFEVVLKFNKKAKQATPKEAKDHFKVQDIGYKKILIVEDKKLNQMVTSETLKGWWQNIEIDTADDGQQAVEKVHDKNYDLILMDVQMPIMDGYEATRYIREKMQPPARETPILAITAYNTDGEADKCLEAGMNDFVPKPLEPGKLYRKIMDLIHPDGAGPERVITKPKPEQQTATPIKTENDKLNFSNLNTATGGNEELKTKIIDLLLEETPEEINRLKETVEEKNWKKVRGAAHKLKSSISYMGLNNTLELAKKIEDSADAERQVDQIPDMAKQVINACQQALEELKSQYVQNIDK